MPNIATYNAPITQLEIPTGGAEAFQQTARVQRVEYDQAGHELGGAISQAGSQIGKKIDDANAMHDIAAGSLEMMQTEQSLAQEHDQLLQASVTPDPENGTPDEIQAARQSRAEAQDKLDKFMENRAQPAMQAVADKYSKSDRATAHMTGSMVEFTRGMYRQFAADRANVAGQQAISNLDSLRNQAVNATLADPEKADLYRGQFLRTVQGMTAGNPYLKPQEAAKINDHYTEQANDAFAEAMVKGYMNKSQFDDSRGEEAARKILDGGSLDKYLVPGKKEALIKAVDEHQKARLSDIEAKKRQAREDAADKSKAAAGDILSSWSANGGVPKPGDQTAILGNKDLEPATRIAMSDAADRLIKEGDKKNAQGVEQDTMAAYLSGKLTEPELLRHVGKDMSQGTADFFLKLLKGPNNSNKKFDDDMLSSTLNEVQTTIGVKKDMFGGLMAGPQNHAYNAVLSWTLNKLDAGMRNGQGLRQMLDPTSDAYIYKSFVKGNKLDFSSFGGGYDPLKELFDNGTAPAPGANRPSLDKIFGGN